LTEDERGSDMQRVDADRDVTISIVMPVGMVYKIDEKRRGTDLSRSGWIRQAVKPILKWREPRDD
jgi:hypothetical protein